MTRFSTPWFFAAARVNASTRVLAAVTSSDGASIAHVARPARATPCSSTQYFMPFRTSVRSVTSFSSFHEERLNTASSRGPLLIFAVALSTPTASAPVRVDRPAARLRVLPSPTGSAICTASIIRLAPPPIALTIENWSSSPVSGFSTKKMLSNSAWPSLNVLPPVPTSSTTCPPMPTPICAVHSVAPSGFVNCSTPPPTDAARSNPCSQPFWFTSVPASSVFLQATSLSPTSPLSASTAPCSRFVNGFACCIDRLAAPEAQVPSAPSPASSSAAISVLTAFSAAICFSSSWFIQPVATPDRAPMPAPIAVPATGATSEPMPAPTAPWVTAEPATRLTVVHGPSLHSPSFSCTRWSYFSWLDCASN